MEPRAGKADDRLQNIRVYWLAFVIYWQIAGGVVSQPFFCKHFGLLDASGKAITSKTNAVLQRRVLPLSRRPLRPPCPRKPTLVLFTRAFSLGPHSPLPPRPRYRPHLRGARRQRHRH
ncbi:hypothetical protein B0H13DRAFT_2333118 [Mycena leptocephala]|nr:hypothetical protein B0H13DRAFT_2333118 [Mycena leptocephala]